MGDSKDRKWIDGLILDINGTAIKRPLDGGVVPPSKDTVMSILSKIGFLMFSTLSPLGEEKPHCQKELAEQLYFQITACISGLALSDDLSSLARTIMLKIPTVKAMLLNDAEAILRGDPAASSVEEIIACYPGFLATLIYRIAHVFYLSGVVCLPRMMTELAHGMTGIDIHPGAKIGKELCIDHGTGIVIGETAIIGDRVKIYQGVTIGAKSIRSDTDGRIIKEKKRHPTIGNDCIIYAGATILGGDTVIGDRCIIGGNVWLTHSLSPDRTVYYKES